MNCKKESDIFNLVSINGINITLDNINIKNIKRTTWFRTLELYPKTIAHMKLLIDSVDRVGIFNKYNIRKMDKMSGKRLDMIYAILRICNKIFTDYLNNITNYISVSIKNLIDMENLYDNCLLDQLNQDIDFFISNTIGENYPVLTMNAVSIRILFEDYLKKTFNKNFYRKLFKKNKINDKFYVNNEAKFVYLVDKLVKSTKEILVHNLDRMVDFLDKIFDLECPSKTIKEICICLENFDLKNLFEEHCLELDIYSEYKLDFEFQLNQHNTFNNSSKSDMLSTNNYLVELN